MSRATKAYASGYQLGREHESTIAKGESRLYECDFTGALDGETIDSAQWGSDGSTGLTLSGLTQAAGVVSVTVLAEVWGWSVMRCEITTSADRILSQSFRVSVQYPGCVSATALTWVAP